MWRLLPVILEKYGFLAFGLSVNIGVTIYCFYKLFTNHLAHIAEDIKENKKEIKSVGRKVTNLSGRVSKIEGKLDK